ncbi:phage replisome organizer N-terminal domain-containing protein [Streptococcus parauberis]|uniref:Replisome organizer n=1 Tax=Streptococcus parauberis KRS-02083 TaxID=1207545 RepID=A0ABN0IPD1_9STRE|nr:phage replisome organizer N-terminal domain-containing protein [Streptococcus parauberis]EMG24683.1 replisome organizer [Streptococcus parauberis KRS-02083]QBX27553.1 DNA replication protein [Streptococcus phage Javan394]
MTKKTKTKIYFWLRLDNNFFKNLAIKQLRRISGGDTYIIIYIKMMLLSLETEGFIYFEGVLDNIAEEIAMALDEQIEDVQMTLSYFTKKGLVQIGEDGAEMLQVPALIDQETNWNRYKRNQKKLEQSNESWKNSNHIPTNSNLIPTEKEIEKEIKIDKEIKTDKEKEVDTANGDQQPEYTFFDLCNDFKENLGHREKWTPLRMDDLRYWSEDYGNDLVREALVTAVRQGKSSFAYIDSILKNWERDGLTTVELVRNHEEQRKNKISKQSQQQKPNIPDWSKVNDPDYVAEQLSKEEQEIAQREVLNRLNKLKKE